LIRRPAPEDLLYTASMTILSDSSEDHPLFKKYKQAADEYERAVKDLALLGSGVSKEAYNLAVDRMKAARRATEGVRRALSHFDTEIRALESN
jgi:hypothetical protein